MLKRIHTKYSQRKRKPQEEQSTPALLSSALELDVGSFFFFSNFPIETQAAREVLMCSASSVALGSFLPTLFLMPVVSQGRVSLISNTSL